MAQNKPYLIHRPERSTGLKNRAGKHIVEFGNHWVDEWWVLKNYGRAVLDVLERDGKYEDERKEIVIVKIEPPKKEEISTGSLTG